MKYNEKRYKPKSAKGRLPSFSRDAGFMASIPGSWKEVMLFPDLPAGEVAWMCAAPVG
jgi:hypothetical protein